MSKTPPSPPRDKRSRPDLDLFVLAMVVRGVNTPYKLLTEAGLSQGASLQVLARLEAAGHVRRGEPGLRGRSEAKITAAGQRHLHAGWQPLLDAPIPPEIESVLRTICVAVLSGARKKALAAYLKRAASDKAAESKLRKAAASEAKGAVPVSSGPGLYKRMVALNAATRLASEARLLRQLAAELPKRS
jgi:hypothetical protein